jgi:hypothetical protein
VLNNTVFSIDLSSSPQNLSGYIIGLLALGSAWFWFWLKLYTIDQEMSKHKKATEVTELN